MLRVFLGIDLNPELKFKIEEVKSKNKLADLPIKLAEAENSHIALKFLDELKDWQIEQIMEKVTLALKGVKDFSVIINNCLICPNFGNTRVLVLRVESPILVDLGQKIFRELDKLQFVVKEERKYTPHITLGRIKEKLTGPDKEKIAGIKFKASLSVNAVCLFESNLSSVGPTYAVLKKWKLQ